MGACPTGCPQGWRIEGVSPPDRAPPMTGEAGEPGEAIRQTGCRKRLLKRNRREKGNRPQENEEEPTKDSGRLSGFQAAGCRIYGFGSRRAFPEARERGQPASVSGGKGKSTPSELASVAGERPRPEVSETAFSRIPQPEASEAGCQGSAPRLADWPEAGDGGRPTSAASGAASPRRRPQITADKRDIFIIGKACQSAYSTAMVTLCHLGGCGEQTWRQSIW